MNRVRVRHLLPSTGSVTFVWVVWSRGARGPQRGRRRVFRDPHPRPQRRTRPHTAGADAGGTREI